jgi:hypothetical protein
MTAIVPVGCAQSGPLTSRNTMLGSLKASVSQLEFDNEKLRKEVAELKADNARLDNMYAQERDANGEITARLDDAKDLLRRQGGDVQALGIPSKTFEDDGIPPPARRTKGRKPPAANISRPSPTPFDSPDDRGFDSTSTDRSRDLGPIGRSDDDRWLPVARGLGSTIPR